MTKIVTNIRDYEWERFLNNYHTASIYHTPQWKDFLVKTFNYESHYLFAKDKNDNITGLLSLFYIKSKLSGNRLCSVPFSHLCGYIGSEHLKDVLINKGVDLSLKTDANYFEIRDLVNHKFKLLIRYAFGYISLSNYGKFLFNKLVNIPIIDF